MIYPSLPISAPSLAGLPIPVDPKRVQEFFEDFYEDVFEELAKFGEVRNGVRGAGHGKRRRGRAGRGRVWKAPVRRI